MQYRQIGKTGEQVSALGFGLMRLPRIGGDNSRIDTALAERMVRHAIDNGITYFDTAYPYHSTSFEGQGSCEPFIGSVLRQDGLRQKVKLATKLPSWMIHSRKQMDDILHTQLRALQTETIDFYLLHTLNWTHWPKLKSLEVFDFLEKAKAAGKIRHIGFSFHDTYDCFEDIVTSYDWGFAMIQYNYLDEAYQAGTKGAALAADKDMGLVVMEPLRGGMMTVLPQKAGQIFAQQNPDRTPADWALRWVLNHSCVSTVLSGMSTMEQLQQNIRTANTAESGTLSSTQLEAYQKASQIINSLKKVDCTACRYCCPCPNGVDIPVCFTIYNNYFMFDSDANRRTSKFHYGFRLKPEQQASNCIACGKCETHCPQHIQIINTLKEVDALFHK